MELLMIYKISPSPSLPSGPEALWAGGQRGGKKGKTFLKKEREKAEMTHSITRRAIKIFTLETAEDGEAKIQKVGVALQPLSRRFKTWNARMKSDNFHQRPFILL